MHFFGSERGAAGDADAVRHLPGHINLRRRGTRTLGPRPRPSSSRSTSGPNGTPCPGDAAALLPALRAPPRAATPPGPTPRSRSTSIRERRRPEPRRALGHDSTRLLRHAEGLPYCPESAIAAARRSHYSGSPSRPIRCPGRLADRHGVVGAGAGSRPALPRGRVYLAGPYKGAPLSLVVVTPAVSGPTTSATSWSGRRSGRSGHRPGHRRAPIRSPRSSTAIPLRLRSIRSTSTARTSRSTRPTAIRSRSTLESPATKERRRAPQHALPGRQLREPAVRAEADRSAFPGGVKRRGHPAHPRRRHRRRPAKPTLGASP